MVFYQGDSPRALDVTRSLQPLSIVEDEGFRNFVKTLEPHYKMQEMCGSFAQKVKKTLDIDFFLIQTYLHFIYFFKNIQMFALCLFKKISFAVC